jgi:hypothetical protein
MSNEMKVKRVAFKIAFLMPHQEVLPDLELEALQICPLKEVNKESDEYLQGARDALLFLITTLKEKNSQ